MLLLLACSPFAEAPAAVVSPWVATVLEVGFDTTGEREAWVEYGEDEGYGLSTAPTVATHHRHALVGLPAGTTIHWRVVVDGEPGEDHADENGLLPSTMPTLTTVEGAPTWSGYLLTTLIGGWQGPVMLDDQGRIVWYAAQDAGATQPIRARRLEDGSGVVYNEVVSGDEPQGALNFVGWNGEPRDTWEDVGISHDFLELEDGRFASIEVEKHNVDDELVLGDRIALLDGETSTTLWSSFDWFDPATTAVDRPEGSWTHANALDLDGDTLHLGIRNFDSIVSIDLGSGELLDAIGGEVNNGWSFPGVDRVFQRQHQFQFFDDRLLVFDNGEVETDATRVVEYQLNPAAKTATEVWSYGFDPPQWLYALGDVQRLDDGSTLVAWDVGGRLQQVDADGTTLWQLESEVGYAFGYMERLDALW